METIVKMLFVFHATADVEKLDIQIQLAYTTTVIIQLDMSIRDQAFSLPTLCSLHQFGDKLKLCDTSIQEI